MQTCAFGRIYKIFMKHLHSCCLTDGKHEREGLREWLTSWFIMADERQQALVERSILSSRILAHLPPNSDRKEKYCFWASFPRRDFFSFAFVSKFLSLPVVVCRCLLFVHRRLLCCRCWCWLWVWLFCCLASVSLASSVGESVVLKPILHEINGVWTMRLSMGLPR